MIFIPVSYTHLFTADKGFCKRTSQGDDRALCGAVVDEPIVALISGDGGGVDDRPTLRDKGKRLLNDIEKRCV